VISKASDGADAVGPAGAVVARFELRSGGRTGAADAIGVTRERVKAGRAGSTTAVTGSRAERPTIVIAGGTPAGVTEADLLRQLVSVAETRLAELVDPPTGPVERPVLSPRERECLQWTAAGKTTWEIAGILAISTNTVDGYIASATRKLGAVNRTQAAVVALRRALID
jgi:DNA-binding CsgD family transcriptional regulator